jgi:hypothetical protein
MWVVETEAKPEVVMRSNRIRERVKDFKQLLNGVVNDFYGSRVFSFQVAEIVVLHGIFTFGAVQLRQSLPLPLLAVFSFWAVALFPLEAVFSLRLGQIFDSSQSLIAFWHRNLPWTQRRHVTSLRPFGVKAGQVLQKESALQIITVICKAAKSLLLIF